VTNPDDLGIICSLDIEDETDSNCEATGLAVGSGDCATGEPSGNRDDAKPHTDPYPLDTTVIHWTVMDEFGETDESDQTVTVVDVTHQF